MTYAFVATPDIKSLWEAASIEPTFQELLNYRIGRLPLDTLITVSSDTNPREIIRTVRLITKLIDDEHPERMYKDEILELENKMFIWAETLRKAFGSLDAIAGKRILDLGCGARSIYSEQTNGEDYMSGYTGNYMFEPWFCRMVHSFGGQATGLDIRVQENELFNWHAIDLNNPDNLECIPSGTIDALHCDNYWIQGLNWDNAEFLDYTIAYSEQLKRILAPDAYIIGRYCEEFKSILCD